MYTNKNTRTMKTIHVMMVGLWMLIGTTQVSAITYAPLRTPHVSQQAVQQPIQQSIQQPTQSFGATAPQVTFQSTGTMQMGTGAVVSPLNANGTVNVGAYGIGSYSPSRPRRIDANEDGYDDDTGQPVNPVVDEDDDEGNTPLGDALIPLLLMAAGYAFCRARRKKVVVD